MPKKPTQQDLDRSVKNVQQKASHYKAKAADLATQFNKAMNDKTLYQNKNMFQTEIEKDLLAQMVQLAIDINNDPIEDEGMGSLSWIVLLLKTSFAQRDKINLLEYQQSQLVTKNQEILKLVDKLVKGE